MSIRKVGGSPSLSHRPAEWSGSVDGQLASKAEEGTPPPLQVGPPGAGAFRPGFLLARAEQSYWAGLRAGRGQSEINARHQADALRDVTAAIRGMLAEPVGREANPKLSMARALHSSAQEEFLRTTSGRLGPTRRGVACQAGAEGNPT